MDKKTKKNLIAINLISDELSEKYNNDKELNKSEKELLLISIANLRTIREQLGLND